MLFREVRVFSWRRATYLCLETRHDFDSDILPHAAVYFARPKSTSSEFRPRFLSQSLRPMLAQFCFLPCILIFLLMLQFILRVQSPLRKNFDLVSVFCAIIAFSVDLLLVYVLKFIALVDARFFCHVECKFSLVSVFVIFLGLIAPELRVAKLCC